jgi:hypothetical protein
MNARYGSTLMAVTFAAQALACASADGTDPTDAEHAYPPEWDAVGLDAPADLPEGPDRAPPLPDGGSASVGTTPHIFTPSNPAASRSLQRGSLWLCFDEGACCSASFLNNNSILTAAHCLPQPNRNALHAVTMQYEMPDGSTRNWAFRPCTEFFGCPDRRMFFYPHPNQTQSNPDNVSPQWDVAIGNICAAGAPCDTGGLTRSFGLTSEHFVLLFNQPPWDGLNMTLFASGAPQVGVKRAMRVVVDDANSNDMKWRKWATGQWVCGGDSGGPHLRGSGYSDSFGDYWLSQVGVQNTVFTNATITLSDGSTIPCGDSGMASRVRSKIGWIQSIVSFWSPKVCPTFTNPNGEQSAWCFANP